MLCASESFKSILPSKQTKPLLMQQLQLLMQQLLLLVQLLLLGKQLLLLLMQQEQRLLLQLLSINHTSNRNVGSKRWLFASTSLKNRYITMSLHLLSLIFLSLPFCNGWLANIVRFTIVFFVFIRFGNSLSGTEMQKLC